MAKVNLTYTVKPFSFNNDQHQLSHDNINTSLGKEVMRINKQNTKGKKAFILSKILSTTCNPLRKCMVISSENLMPTIISTWLTQVQYLLGLHLLQKCQSFCR